MARWRAELSVHNSRPDGCEGKVRGTFFSNLLSGWDPRLGPGSPINTGKGFEFLPEACIAPAEGCEPNTACRT
eukprot:390638-Heterocapsa_arctica.AAC.1